jgi:hypothetical protein
MSFVRAVPEFLGTSASRMASIGSTISASNAIAAVPTVSLSAAAGDQVSAAVAAFFSGHARGYQTLSAQAADFHNQFVQKLSAGANTYAVAEAANAAPIQQLLNGSADSTVGSPTPGGGIAGSGADGLSKGSGNAVGSGAMRHSGVNGGAGGSLRMATTCGSSSTGAGEPRGSDRFGGLLVANNGIGGAAGASSGNTTTARPGGVGGLLSAAGRMDQTGNRTSGDAVLAGALLLRPVDADGGHDKTGGAGQLRGGKAGAGDPAGTAPVGRAGIAGKGGWLFTGRCAGGSGGQLSRVIGAAGSGRLRVTPGAGGNGGLSAGPGAASLRASTGGGSAGWLSGSNESGRTGGGFAAGRADGRTTRFHLAGGSGAGTRVAADSATADPGQASTFD